MIVSGGLRIWEAMPYFPLEVGCLYVWNLVRAMPLFSVTQQGMSLWVPIAADAQAFAEGAMCIALNVPSLAGDCER